MLKRVTSPQLTPSTARRTTAAGLNPTLAEPERLVGLGFRYWTLGRQTGDIGHWERTWSLYSGLFGLCGARLAVGTLSSWVTVLNQTAQREIQVFPDSRSDFCRDECMAVSMIAACQHQTCPAMRACAFALIECAAIDRVVGEAQGFADTMIGLEQRLSHHSIVPASIAVATTTRPN
jgi:hypothetical protein